jgi:predicted amidohydrolase
MNSIPVYTVCIVQPVHRFISHRKEIGEILTRYSHLIDTAQARFGRGWAPLKMIAFPEFFLQGFTKRANMDDYWRNILISIPGEETERLGEKAREHGLFIVGAALEKDPLFPNLYFNTAFILNPEGKVIHKYRKLMPAIHAEMAMSPHDVYDRYMEICGTGQSLTETFFPVTETPIGKIGTFICMDGHFPEITRALALQGAEILIRPTAFPEPLISPPMQTWELENRTRAYENAAYVIAPNTGEVLTEEAAAFLFPGDSMVVDFNGVIVARAPYPGETIVSAVIHLEDLRRLRQDPRRNYLTQIRCEAFQELYQNPIYPKNKFLESPLLDKNDLAKRESREIIEAFSQKGIYIKPRD